MSEVIEKVKNLAEAIKAAQNDEREEKAHVNSRAVIDEYHEWRILSEDLFNQYFDDSNSHYKKFINLPTEGNGFTLMKYFSQQYPIFKLLINKIENGEDLKRSKQNKDEIKSQNPEKTVFISHASKDKEIADAFVDVILQGGLSVPIEEIFCVSTDGTKIESGEDWRNTIYESLNSAKINFLIITPNYKESEVCLNEMGASWVTNAKILPMIVEPINYETVGVIQKPKQIEKLLDEKSLDRIKDVLQEKLEIPPIKIKSDRWTAKKKEFLTRVNKHLKETTFQVPIDRSTFDKLLQEKDDLEKTIENLIHEKSKLVELNKELEKTKDKIDVQMLKDELNPSSQFQEFEELCEIVKEGLTIYSPIVNGVIFKTYTGKQISIRWREYKDELDEAIANDFIDTELEADFDTTREMRELKKALDEIDNFLSDELSDDFSDNFETKYNAPLKLDNKLFWEEVFDTSVFI